jgi:hypothetical protein
MNGDSGSAHGVGYMLRGLMLSLFLACERELLFLFAGER